MLIYFLNVLIVIRYLLNLYRMLINNIVCVTFWLNICSYNAN